MRRIFFAILVIAGGMNGVMGQCNITPSQKSLLGDTILVCYEKSITFDNLGVVTCDGSITYQWESKSGGNNWSSASNSNMRNDTADYTTENLNNSSALQYFRRIVTCTGSITCRDTTDEAVVIVRPRFNAGAISGSSVVCSGETTPIIIGSGTLASGGDTVFTYRWFKNDTLIQNSGDSASYVIPDNDKVYRQKDTITYTRYALNKTCGDSVISNGNFKLIVYPQLQVTGPSGTQTICYDTPPTQLTVTASGGNGTYTYQWQKRPNSSSSWENVGTSSANYTSPRLVETTRFRCVVTSGGCGSVNSSAVTVTVREEFSAGAITSKDTVVCLKADLPTITAITPPSGDRTAYSYRWKKNGVIISGAANQSYKIPIVDTAGTFTYIREVYDSCTGTWVQSSGSWRVSAAVLPIPNGETTICSTIEAMPYTISSPNPAVTYEWKLSPSNAGSIVGDGSGAILIKWSSTYSGAVALTVTAKISGCGDMTSQPLQITVNQSPDIQYAEAANPVCGNQKGLVYEINELYGYDYDWRVVNGKILEQNKNTNKVTVNWDNNSGSSITAIVSKGNCYYESTLEVAVFPSSAPDAENIVPKKDENGKPYMLICPNPTNSNLVYQWYMNEKPIFVVEGKDTNYAKEQFFYPPNYKQTLYKDSAYTVRVAEASSVACGNYSEPYIYTGKLVPQAKYFSVSPNPVESKTFTVSFNRNLLQESTDYVLSIYSVAGIKIWEEKINSLNDVIITESMAAGIYTITLSDNKKQYKENIVVK